MYGLNNNLGNANYTNRTQNSAKYKGKSTNYLGHLSNMIDSIIPALGGALGNLFGESNSAKNKKS